MPYLGNLGFSGGFGGGNTNISTPMGRRMTQDYFPNTPPPLPNMIPSPNTPPPIGTLPSTGYLGPILGSNNFTPPMPPIMGMAPRRPNTMAFNSLPPVETVVPPIETMNPTTGMTPPVTPPAVNANKGLTPPDSVKLPNYRAGRINAAMGNRPGQTPRYRRTAGSSRTFRTS